MDRTGPSHEEWLVVRVDKLSIGDTSVSRITIRQWANPCPLLPVPNTEKINNDDWTK